MADFKDRMADYVPVNERLAALLDKYPDASLQSEIVELTDTRVTIKAIAYRTPDDARPGIGHSSMEIPGGTPYTRGSEIENAETSAWGRAIAALGFEVKRGLASAEEVRNKQPEHRGPAKAASNPSGAPVQTDGALRDAVAAAAFTHNVGTARLSLIADAVGVPKGQRANADQLRAILARIETPQPEVALSDAATTQGSGVEAVSPGIPPDPAPAQTLLDEAVRIAEAPAEAVA